MDALACVFFHMQASDADAFGHSVARAIERRNIDPPVFRQGLVELRNLIALGQVRIKIVFARKDRILAHFTIDRRRRQHSKFHGALIQHRQRAW